MPRQQKKGSGGAKAKGRQQAHNKALGTYRRQFIRTVLRTGRWRGRKANVSEAR